MAYLFSKLREAAGAALRGVGHLLKAGAAAALTGIVPRRGTVTRIAAAAGAFLLLPALAHGQTRRLFVDLFAGANI